MSRQKAKRLISCNFACRALSRRASKWLILCNSRVSLLECIDEHHFLPKVAGDVKISHTTVVVFPFRETPRFASASRERSKKGAQHHVRREDPIAHAPNGALASPRLASQPLSPVSCNIPKARFRVRGAGETLPLAALLGRAKIRPQPNTHNNFMGIPSRVQSHKIFMGIPSRAHSRCISI